MRATEKQKRYMREYYLKNKEELKKKKRDYYLKNRKHLDACAKKWREKNKERWKQIQHKKYLKYRKKYLAYSLLRQFHSRVALICEMGAKCSRCGYHEYLGILEIHHIKEKRERTWQIVSRFMRTGKIPEDCILLCPNCHSLEHQFGDGKNSKQDS